MLDSTIGKTSKVESKWIISDIQLHEKQIATFKDIDIDHNHACAHAVLSTCGMSRSLTHASLTSPLGMESDLERRQDKTPL